MFNIVIRPVYRAFLRGIYSPVPIRDEEDLDDARNDPNIIVIPERTVSASVELGLDLDIDVLDLPSLVSLEELEDAELADFELDVVE